MMLFYAVVNPGSYISTLPSNTTMVARQYLPQRDTGVVKYGATQLCITPTAPHGPSNTSTQKLCVGTATGHVDISLATASLPIPQLAEDFTTTGYIMSSFTKTLVGIGSICDADCTVLFTKQDVTVL